ncbi:phosphonoacetaldehyde hydrolase [Azospirillum sp. RWY-5-1]|uniref:Phosphonoacetaldehyde hydrolase n=1 Tax=Azospirillum oleiclasticum TaxID=2735135 RepID=A0ABX2TKU8_9PROT|nr:phosphonoacetaldehyde hydrolase [Azospirillum oleiclasticum]NYZ17619.1 phosphonoacetaldehyde hydrolase [Azospirillum oleiclasticum]NYZ24913.1 phosphonoacetaldehyde hydrolase [Azospirillum oleiclasticum]
MSYTYTRRYTGPLQAVVLDWAGTTVDFGCLAPAGAFMEAFRRHKVEITLEQARGPMGMPKWDHIKAVLAMPAVAAAWVTRYGRRPDDADVDSLYETFLPLQVEVVDRYADVIPGVVDAIASMRQRGMRIGSTTGYPRQVLQVVQKVAAAQGYEPDIAVAAGDTPTGRPGPAMALRCVIELGISPVEACVKIGDTTLDVEEGLNAGMWTIALTDTGNEVGVPLGEWSLLSEERRAALRAPAEERLRRAGAHYVAGSLLGALPLLDDIEARLARGERP